VMQIDEDVDGIEQSDQMLREIGDGIDAQIRPGCLMRATRRYGAFATLTLRAIAKIKAGELEADNAAAHFEQVTRNHRLRRCSILHRYAYHAGETHQEGIMKPSAERRLTGRGGELSRLDQTSLSPIDLIGEFHRWVGASA